MSGFEIAGIILGSIPLVISALEHAGEGISAIQRWRKYKRELESLIRNLQTEQLRLQDVCEKLLIGLVPASEIEAMINDPLGKLWSREGIENKIRLRLWKASRLFKETVEGIKVAIDEMKAEIDSQKDGNVSQIRRGVFTLKRSRYDDLLSTIRSGVSNLENLTNRNINLESDRRVQSQGRLFKTLRDMASGLYRALRASFGCSCAHQVGLELQRLSPTVTPNDDDDYIMKMLCLKLAISYSFTALSSGNNALNWQEIAITATNPPLPPAVDASRAAVTLPTVPLKRKRVSFARFQSTTPTSSTMTATSTLTMPARSEFELRTLVPNLTACVANTVAFSSIGVVLDLCEKLRQSQKQAAGATYGTLVDQYPPTPRSYSVSPTSTTEDSGTWSVVSLRDILEHKTRFPPLSYRERLRLAVVISSSVLQLHGTPWFPTALTTRHIFFIGKKNPPDLTMYQHPVALRHLPEDQTTPPAADQTGPALAGRDPTLLSLGYVLIEVILGRTLDSASGGRADDGGDDPMARYVAAQGLMEEVRLKSTNYWAAVARCVDDGELHARGCGLEDGELCQSVYARVVALLEEDLKNS